MDDVKHILLLANSLSSAESTQVQLTFDAMKKEGVQVKVSILYVKPYFPTCYFHIPSMVSLSEDFESEAKDSLRDIGRQLEVLPENQWIATGRVRPETLKIASTLGVDFILSSASLHKELSQSFTFKKNRFQLPIKTVDNLAA